MRIADTIYFCKSFINFEKSNSRYDQIYDFRMGKLCRRCLGINDATPGILIDKAMDLMGETLVTEVGNKINLFI